MQLSDLKCKSLKPQNKAYKKADGRGLFMLVKPNGTKLWRYKYRFERKERLYSIGVYPEFSLAEAREIHQRLHKLVAQGIDPREHEIEQKRKVLEEKALTFSVMAHKWLEKRKNEVKPKTHVAIEKRVELYILPSIGDIPMGNLTPRDVLKMVKTIEARGTYELAKRARQYCSKILRFAMAHGNVDRDYTLDISDALVTRKVRHQPALTKPDEVKEFLKAFERNEARLHKQTRLGLELLMLTFVRPIEMAEARWDEIDLDKKQWVIPANRMKMGDEHIVPLSKQALRIIYQLKEINGNRDHLLINQRDPKRPMSRDTFSKAVRLLGFQGRHSGHGFRAMARTLIHEQLEYDETPIERQLSHKANGPLGSAYDRTKFLDKRVQMMQDWADYLEKFIS
ncbi:integrase arm-type DNA-binding domain-containing protein [uncultured Roseivirga sp.]|uniref:tyrosine-type recombinase/integrase n=1 Tax=uncultured Roseivirga sp. TaxID=543088 RepID=UPI0030DDAB48|tara:strand:+ start:275 stop:1462 length:1188 start_codon:yes stop_codon:yes gene_type:complete